MTHTIQLTTEQLQDIVVALGGKLPGKRVLGEGFTGLQRLELREKLERKLNDRSQFDHERWEKARKERLQR